MRVLLAPTLSGDDPARLAAGSTELSRAWSGAAPHDTVDLCALSDGGPGFASLVSAGLPRTDPSWLAPGVLLVGGPRGTAYVDGSVGLRHRAGTAGLGEQLLTSLAGAPSRVVLGLPGPDRALVPDAGSGLLGALGVDGLCRGAPVGAGLADRHEGVDDLDGLEEVLVRLSRVDLVGAAANDLPLLGLHGASAAAGASGALSQHEAQELERAVGELASTVWSAFSSQSLGPTTGRFEGVRPAAPGAAVTAHQHQSLLAACDGAGTRTASRLRDVTGLPGAGAGGGAGWLIALAGGRLLPGAAVHAEAVGLARRVAASDLVVATVDHLDAATFHHSGAEQAAVAAAAVGVPCVVVAGTSMMSRRESSAAGLSAVYVATEAADLETGPSSRLLADVVRRVARSWSPARAVTR